METRAQCNGILGKAVGCLLSWAAFVPAHAAPPTDPAGRDAAVGRPIALVVRPETVDLAGPHAMQQVTVAGRYADGSMRDVTALASWSAAGAGVDLEPGGFLWPRRDGQGLVTVQAGGQSTRVPVRVRELSRTEPISFRRQVMGALNVSGCNSGSCHGIPSGRGGFRLSLWGQDPAADHVQLTRDTLGRRADRLAPEASLVLLKALGRVPHEGGQRFAPGSLPARLLRGWLVEGMHDDPADLPGLTGVTVTTEARILRAPNRWVQLAIRAAFADSSSRDVTRLTVFGTSDPGFATVTPSGLVEFQQGGEAAILCRYLDRMVSVRLTYLDPPADFHWPAPPENNYVDRHVFARLQTLGIVPAERCSDQEFVRRVYLDVCGMLPPAAAARAYLADSRPDRRERLIETLLARPEHADFWTLKWADLLRIKKTFIQPQGVQTYHAWLRDAVRTNRPFDEVVRALLTSQGHSYKNGPANYYGVIREPKNAGDLIQHDMTETTSILFLGIRMQCAKCHNHPFEHWSQDDYFGLAAFFAQVKQTREGKAPGVGNPEHRPVSISLDAKAPEIVQPRTGRTLPPRFPGGAAAAIAAGQDRRAALADWLTRGDNPFFTRALANRIWFHLIGRGIVEPVDDFRDSNPAANDALLDALARDLVAHGFDVQHLMRVILTSRTYQLSARAHALNRQDLKYFSHVIARPLSAEQLLDAICTATGVPETYEGHPLGTRAIELPDGEVITNKGTYLGYDRHPFMKTFGQPARELACECGRENDFTLAQALELMNGPTVSAKLSQPDNRIGRLLAAGKSDADILDELYLTTLARPPASPTARALLAHVARAANRRQAWEDVLWTLLRSKEFIYRH